VESKRCTRLKKASSRPPPQGRGEKETKKQKINNKLKIKKGNKL